MTFPQVTVIAVDSAIAASLLAPVHRMEFLADSEIHMVQMIQKVQFGDGLSFNVAFALEEDESVIEKAVISKMEQISKSILPYTFTGKIHYKCLFGDEPKADFCEYLKQVKCELVLIGSRQKHGLFESSFAKYVVRHAPCSSFVLKPREI